MEQNLLWVSWFGCLPARASVLKEAPRRMKCVEPSL